MKVQITIDGKPLTVPEGLSVRKAALKNGIYIPGICGHPFLPPARQVHWSKEIYQGDRKITGDRDDEIAGEFANCNLCRVAVEGVDGLVRACETKAADGMVVRTHGEDIRKARQEALAKILAHHPHACLTCAQREGCSLTQCSSNVPEDERCCILLNRCELGKIVDYIGLPEGTPKYVPEHLPKITSDPFFERDYNLCIGCLRCVRICSEIRGVDALGATLREGRIWVGTHLPGALADSYCRFCNSCVEVCPTGALLDKPDSKPVTRGGNAPCVDACPAGIDVPAYVRRVALGDYKGALEVIYRSVPFPGILGYVCFHPCEDACKHNELDGVVAICALKRFVYESVPKDQRPKLEKRPSTGKKVAVIGSGPAGLSAAFYLKLSGHDVDVVEAADKPGGMLRQAIPEYRLPVSVLDDELQILYDLGIGFLTGKRLGVDVQLADLTGHYDAVLLAIGSSAHHELGIPGEDLEGVMQTLDLLRSVRAGERPDLSGRVIVIGGGNVAVDAAMTAKRLGSEDVVMVCLEKEDEMPAHSWELDQAREEGIRILNGWGPMEFAGESGKLTGIRFKRCTRVFDEEGRFNPQYDEKDTTELDADVCLIAIGQKVDWTGLDDFGLTAGSGVTLRVDPVTMMTDIPGVFAAGDAVRGPSSVVDAIAAGRKAADAMDRFLGGSGVTETPPPDEIRDDPYLGRDEKFHQRESYRPRYADPAVRVENFSVIEQSLSPDEARNYAEQCLRCNLRAAITPVFLPPDKWQPLTAESVAALPDGLEGVYRLAGTDKKVTKIVGTANLKEALSAEVEKQPAGTLFCWEEDRMYSQRESELIQQHLQQYGEMPGGGEDDLDDLF